jgi:hypothetical protein
LLREQKSYAGVRWRALEFEVGDEMLLKVSLTKGIVRFGTKGKLSPRYIGPYVISTHVGALPYISVAVTEVYCRSTPGVSCLADDGS